MTLDRVPSLDALAADLKIDDLPASWRRHWPAFCAWQRDDPDAAMRWRVRPEVIDAFGLPPDCLPDLQTAMDAILARPPLRRIVELWNYLIYTWPDHTGDNSNAWPLPPTIAGVPLRALGLAVVVAGGERALAAMAASGLPADVQRASLAMIGLKVSYVHSRRGVWGMESVTFHGKYVRAELFRLGRLVFGVSPADACIEVHIPGDGRLEPAVCADAYRQAIAVLPSLHGGPLRGFTCNSWLLDPVLKQLLPTHSNILTFAAPYSLLSEGGDHRQGYDLIFGNPDIDPAAPDAPQTTTLQRAVVQHARRGGSVRSAVGFLPWKDAVRLYPV